MTTTKLMLFGRVQSRLFNTIRGEQNRSRMTSDPKPSSLRNHPNGSTVQQNHQRIQELLSQGYFSGEQSILIETATVQSRKEAELANAMRALSSFRN